METSPQCPACGAPGAYLRTVRARSSNGKRLNGWVRLGLGGLLLALAAVFLAALVASELRGGAAGGDRGMFIVNLVAYLALGLWLVLPYAGSVRSPYYRCSQCRKKWTAHSQALVKVCPQCGGRQVTTRTFALDAAGSRVEQEQSGARAILGSLGGMALGVLLCGWVALSLGTALGSDSCSLEAIALVCKDYTNGLQVEMTVNLLLAAVGALAGLSGVGAGVAGLARHLRLAGRPRVYAHACDACKHAWEG